MTLALPAPVKKNPLLAVCSVLAVALIAAIYFRSGLVDEANTELDQKSAEARRYAANITNAAQLKEQVDTLTAANQGIRGRLIRASEIGINQQFFYKLESDTGVKLVELSQNMRGGAGAKVGPFVAVTFTVSAQGDFNQIMAFLRGIEDGSHFCRILDGTLGGGRTTPVNLTLTLELLGQP